ncbi:hypothetical protein Lal_00026532 [Lupinus albus]|nr:hypothetical protein Lal_00026532 [Lupinus albus]
MQLAKKREQQEGSSTPTTLTLIFEEPILEDTMADMVPEHNNLGHPKKHRKTVGATEEEEYTLFLRMFPFSLIGKAKKSPQGEIMSDIFPTCHVYHSKYD